MNCQNNIEKIKDVAQSEEFYYQKLQDVFEKFKNYQIPQDNLENLIKNLDFKPFSFDEYLKNNSNFNEFIVLMGQLIAMSDLNGYKKQEWNLYEDKRVIARAGVRQNDWVRNLLNYKLEGSVENLTNSVKNALLFIDFPQNNLTQLSINHKKLVASNLLNLPFDEDTYFEQLTYYFKDELAKYELKNQKNFGLLLSLFLYCEEVRSLWDKNFDYWLVGSSWDGVDKTDEFIQNGIWENGFDDEYLDRVKSAKVGDKIAIKSSYTKTKNLPFDNQNKAVSVMKIKAIGEVVNNPKDGKRLEVYWDNSFEPKEIFGFSYRNTMSKIDKEKWKEPIKWIFEGKEQDDFFNIDTKEDKMNETQREKNFKDWLKTTVDTTAPISSYPIALKRLLPEKLVEFGEVEYPNLFLCTDREYLKNIQNRLLKNGDLHQFNIETQSRVPSAAISKYIEFLEFSSKMILTEQTQPLNQILYGPPGTGKTYNTINKALEIIDGIVPDDRADAKAKFEEYKKAGQIEFITFHQSYGYEEFVEGIKAKTTDKGIEYKIEPGIFKKLSKQAKENYENSQKSLEKLIQEKSLQQKIEQFLNDSLEEQRDFTKTKGGKFKIKDIRDTSVFVFTEDSNYNENILELDIDELFKILDSDIDFKTSRQLAKDVFKINNQRQKDTYYFSMYKEFKKQKFDVVEEEKVEEPLKNHILIIDEINRGNISKIFGELITLIEPSKRIGADEEIKVKLPYSNDDFGVPSNLYIIGTMNTADRSIALMDTALRRRFDFEEMMPKSELLENIRVDDIDIKQLLETINKRIEYLYDRDHTIGHAYFMSLKDEKITDKKAELDNIFKNKIIPLLQEYFYDDWEKILMVLGDGFVQKSEIKSDIFDYKQDDYLEDEKFVYTIKENFDFSKLNNDNKRV